MAGVLDLPGITPLFTGVGLLIAVGLGGLHQRLATATPRLALAGAGATAVAVAAFAATLVMRAATTLGGIPEGSLLPAGVPSPAVVAALALGMALLVYGSGSSWTGVPDRPAGLLLVVAAFSFPALLAVESLGWEPPAWVFPTALIVFAVALVLVGVRLNAERALADGWTPARPAASSDEQAVDGWTNEHVRDGFDVDGAESRTWPIRMAMRLQLWRVMYELRVIGAVEKWLARSLYHPVLRVVGRLWNRETSVEQRIAEHEYALATVTATPRDGLGSPYWGLGVGLSIGWGMLWFGIGWTVGAGIGGWAIPGMVLVVGGLVALALVARTLQHLSNRT